MVVDMLQDGLGCEGLHIRHRCGLLTLADPTLRHVGKQYAVTSTSAGALPVATTWSPNSYGSRKGGIVNPVNDCWR
eukprot:10322282-Alexandrium_andersonii.AAC.1